MKAVPGVRSLPAIFRGFHPDSHSSAIAPVPLAQIARMLLLVPLFLVLLNPQSLHAQKMDLNTNQMSDIWEWKYNAVGIATNADTDNDGVINRLEAIAGTDPFNSNSVPKIPLVSYTSNEFSVTFPSELGKLYILQTTTLPTNGGAFVWSDVTNVICRNGDAVTLTAPAGQATKFFRVVTSDVDTDGDGLNDWEEYMTGLDPLTSVSSGALNSIGQAIGDYAHVAAQLADQNAVYIIATDPTAVQPDIGTAASAFGAFTIYRGGFPLSSIVVNVTLPGPGSGNAFEGLDHVEVPRTVSLPAGVSSQTFLLTPLANTNLLVPVLATVILQSGAGYSIVAPSNASVVIYPSATPKGTGLTGQYYTGSSTIYTNTNNFNPANLITNRVDPAINFIWNTNLTPNLAGAAHSVRWTGQVMPQYSETYFFYTYTDDGIKLWVNDQLLINRWTNQSVTNLIGSIPLQGGVRYNIKMEYFNSTGTARAQLYWWSPNQSQQIIPSNRLYSVSVPAAPASVTSQMSAVAFLNQPFTFTVTGANSPSNYSATGLPPGLGFNSTSGVINGTPTLAGDFHVTVTASNALGLGASTLLIQVIDTGSSVVREVWTNVAGTNIADIPVNTPASVTNTLTTLAGPTNFADNFGERVRGYFTAPATANYSFWISGSDSAELWISNDGEHVNKVRRATAFGTGSQQWNLQAKQKSPWLAMVAGQRYYIEILHKAGVGTNDHWSVGWLQDPTGTNTAPGGIVPGYLLGPYYPLPPIYVPGTLYAANMLAQSGAISLGNGSATLRVNAAGTQAILKYSYSGLTGPIVSQHIHSDAYLTHPSTILFDLDTAEPQPDGSLVWDIEPAGTLSADEIREILQRGATYLNLHTAMYPLGEINGHFTPVNGSQNFTPPPPPPVFGDDHGDHDAAAKFLIQASFGPSPNDITNVSILGYDGWLSYQFSLLTTHHLPTVLESKGADPSSPYFANQTYNTWWRHSVTAPDQLRQKVAFALSEIMVVSQDGVLAENSRALSSYYDMLLDNSFGNFRELMEAWTLHPAMGLYLDMRRNQKGNILAGTHPNENYAREILQLFSVGLNRMWPDGTQVLDSGDNLVPTYNQNVIMGFSAVFTGWDYYQTNQTNGKLPANFAPTANYTNPMVLVPSRHELGTKLLLDNVVLPAAQGSQLISTNFEFDNYCLQDLELALDNIFYNENVGPFVCRQLIQRLVTSNPSRGYLYRVVQKFNDNGSGVRGDMKAVITAILLDYEARSVPASLAPTFGKQREPVCRVTAVARAFPSPPTINGTYTQGQTRTITVTTSTPHMLGNSDVVMLAFSEATTNAAPASQAYGVSGVTANTFNVNAAGVVSATYVQTNTVITVTSTSHGLVAGVKIYLYFTSGGASNQVYTVATVPGGNTFTVTSPDSATRSGNCLYPRLSGGGYVVTGTNVNITTTVPHGLSPGDLAYATFLYSLPPDGEYMVTNVLSPTNFVIISPISNNQTLNGQVVFPLEPPIFNRNGTVELQHSTWNMGNTDGGGTVTSALLQTPLNSPTVFNFFFPDFKFPGILASAGLTTPEFQLTSDTSAAFQMNYLQGGTLATNSNTNGLSSFASGNGAIVLNLNPWLTTNYTSSANIPALVDSLNTLLVAGRLSPGAKTHIINYVTNTSNFAYGTPPTTAQMASRVRAVAHLIVNSPDFTIQR